MKQQIAVTGVNALKIEKNRFYVLRIGKDSWIFTSEEEVMKDLTDKVELNEDLNYEDVQVMKVQILKRKWKIQEIPWFKTFFDLVGLKATKNNE
jgi:hypothetical protein